MRFVILILLVLTCLTVSAQDQPKSGVLYQNDFEKAEVQKVPDDMMVMEGGFAVAEESGNKFLELPEAPLETFGVLFGPTETNGVSVTARVFGTAKGRRSPTFSVGLNGVGGYKLQVSPAKKLIELYRGDELLASAPHQWESGVWTMLRLQSGKTKEGGLSIQGKAWKQGAPEPKEWTISHVDKGEAPPGRPSIWGAPYAGTPIRFDDLSVNAVRN
jgi:hypothetical protein